MNDYTLCNCDINIIYTKQVTDQYPASSQAASAPQPTHLSFIAQNDAI